MEKEKQKQIKEQFRELMKLMVDNEMKAYAKLGLKIFKTVYGNGSEEKLKGFLEIGFIKPDGTESNIYVLTKNGKFYYDLEKIDRVWESDKWKKESSEF